MTAIKININQESFLGIRLNIWVFACNSSSILDKLIATNKLVDKQTLGSDKRSFLSDKEPL
ncbi:MULTISPECIES: hypothetical protein [unclassified Tenacibaculum]|nr:MULTISPECIES: hypothetical protein [unclassified Tenacibaculum]MCF2875797.1 hypothetical protein [Tenacibaculum sp. Cn5-1]MCF2935872.1 hypothetical protein [Tenacibaculum sp. Cn5-34]MCG7512433.1 hypothetical protein [Tenacibaculum sp. Cn5-46]